MFSTKFTKNSKKIFSALNFLATQKDAVDYYNTLVQDVHAQQALLLNTAARRAEYLFKSSAERNREVYQDYLLTAGQQRAAYGASGVGGSSATAQLLLKNSRLQEIINEQNLLASQQAQQAENDLALAQQLQQLNVAAKQYRQQIRPSFSFWKIGSGLFNLFTEE